MTPQYPYEYKSLPDEVIKQRLEKLIALQNKIIVDKTKEMIGKRFEILFEAEARNNATRGKTRGNKDVIVEQKVSLGMLGRVVITEARGGTPIGAIIDKKTK